MSRYILSIDMGSRSIKYVLGMYKNDVIQINKCFIQEIKNDLIKDGAILDLETLKQSMHEFMKKMKIRGKHCIFTFESTAIISRELALPFAKKEDLDSLIKYEIENYLPIAVADYFIEYTILDEFEDNGKKINLLVLAAPKETVIKYRELAGNLKLKPIALDKNANAISKLCLCNGLINDVAILPESTLAFIDIGAANTNLHIISSGKCRLSRTIDFGILETSFLNNEEEMLEKLAEDVRKILRFYSSKSISNTVDHIYIFGGGTYIEDIDVLLSQRLDRKVEKLKNIYMVKNSQDQDLYLYYNAIGALIRL